MNYSCFYQKVLYCLIIIQKNNVYPSLNLRSTFAQPIAKK
ncbi:hypothetical protein HMPREF9075_01774 [Capnocytophaga sp. oral taxon 332 str. F0381]|nr:hypothetical protein HMPREF9075_01774 [Capnocytophaga sp. oral taxon 332 str. F0381]